MKSTRQYQNHNVQTTKKFRIIGLVLLCCSLQGCVFGPACADPSALTLPVYEPLVNGKIAVVELISVNGQTVPEKSLEKAIKGFNKYVSGEVQVIDGEPVHLDLGDDGALTKQQFESVLATAKHRGLSAITFVVAKDFDFFHNRGAYSREESSDEGVRQSIMLNAEVIDRSAAKIPFVSRETFWQIVILHELGHALGVPADRSHKWAGSHCTNPHCVLYPKVDERSTVSAILRLGPPLDLCEKCREEIRRAQKAAEGKFYDSSNPYDPSEEIIRLNPGNPQAFLLRAFERIKRRDYHRVITDCSWAIEGDNDCLEGYFLRAVANHNLGDDAKAAADFREAIRINPEHISSLGMFAWLLSTAPDAKLRDGRYAVELATRACDLTKWKDHSSLRSLAAAYAEVGDFEVAIEYETKAISLSGGNKNKDYYKLLETYRAGEPYREQKAGQIQW